MAVCYLQCPPPPLFPVGLSVCLSVNTCASVSLLVSLPIYLSARPVCLSVCLFVSLPVSLFVGLSSLCGRTQHLLIVSLV